MSYGPLVGSPEQPAVPSEEVAAREEFCSLLRTLKRKLWLDINSLIDPADPKVAAMRARAAELLARYPQFEFMVEVP